MSTMDDSQSTFNNDDLDDNDDDNESLSGAVLTSPEMSVTITIPASISTPNPPRDPDGISICFRAKHFVDAGDYGNGHRSYLSTARRRRLWQRAWELNMGTYGMDDSKMCKGMVILYLIPIFVLAERLKTQLEKEFPSTYVGCVALFCTGLCSALIGTRLPPSTPMVLQVQKVENNVNEANNNRTSIITMNRCCTVHSFLCLLILILFNCKSVAIRFSQMTGSILLVCLLPLVLAYIVLPCLVAGNLDDMDQKLAWDINSDLNMHMFLANLNSLLALHVLMEMVKEEYHGNSVNINAVTPPLAPAPPPVGGDHCRGFLMARAICQLLNVSGMLSTILGLCCRPEWWRRWAPGRICRVYSGACFGVALTIFCWFILGVPRSDWPFCIHTATYASFYVLLWILLGIISFVMPILLYFSPIYSPLSSPTSIPPPQLELVYLYY